MPIQVTGFQGDGGLEMNLQYQGPDTENIMIQVPSVSSDVPACAAVTGVWRRSRAGRGVDASLSAAPPPGSPTLP